MRKQNIAAATAFCGFLMIIALGYLLPQADFSEMEKRYLSKAPTLSWKKFFRGMEQSGRGISDGPCSGKKSVCGH